MTKSELIELIASQQDQLPPKDVELAIKMIIDRLAQSLVDNSALRSGFGSSLHYRAHASGVTRNG